jgi:hypothetical protein
MLLQRREMHQKILKNRFRGATDSDQFFADFRFSGGAFEPNRREKLGMSDLIIKIM